MDLQNLQIWKQKWRIYKDLQIYLGSVDVYIFVCVVYRFENNERLRRMFGICLWQKEFFKDENQNDLND